MIFADLCGYTRVSERVDPERMKSIIDRALRRLADEVKRYGGNIDKFMGDNVMGVFGAPIAHEDDPERAVRAGLAMQAAMGEINEQISEDVGAEFALRVGVNSGEVLAGRIGDGYTVTGDVVNVASRLQGAAEPGTVIVGEVTHRLTHGAIDYVALEPLTLKGKTQPVAAWRAVRTVAGGRMSRAAHKNIPLVGRSTESGQLLALFDRVVADGQPQLVTVVGPAGVGKSRLLRELTLEVGRREPPPVVRLGGCPTYGAGLSFWALGEIVRDTFDIVDTDSGEAAWRKLNSGVTALLEDGGSASGESPDRLAAAIARPLGIEPPTGDSGAPPEAQAPEQMRDRLFSAVRTIIEATTRQRPVLFAVEDIHWADEGMLDLIEHLSRWTSGPVLFVCLARDELLERRADWGARDGAAGTIRLAPLAPEQAHELVFALTEGAGSAVPAAELIEQVAERSGGNPLFAEEMINRILEGGPPESDSLPDSVHSVLAARLDSLPRAERRLLLSAAVVGQTFWEGSLTTGDDGTDVPATLERLQERDLVVATAGSRLAGEREYAFKHVLIRDVAYSFLPKAVRARRHAEVGAFIEERAGDRAQGVVAMVAEHYGRAATLGTAADLEPQELTRFRSLALSAAEAAGDVSAALYSNGEAQGHYEAAMSYADDADEHVRARINEKLGDVAMLLGRADRAAAAWTQAMAYHRGDDDLVRVGDLYRKIGAGLWHKGDREGSIEHYQRGIDLLKDRPPSLELVRLYEEAASLYMHTGDNMLAIYASEKALRLAESLGEAAAASRAHGIFGRVFGRIGDSTRARENLERSVELARGTDPTDAVRALCALGYHHEVSEAGYETARAAYAEALEVAQQIGDLPAQVEVHAFLAQLAAYGGDWREAEAQTAASESLAEREGLDGKLCFPYSMRGVMRWQAGDLGAAAQLLASANEIAEQVGHSEVAFSSLFWLAGVERDRGDHAIADRTLARTLDLCDRAGLVAQSVEATAARAVNLAVWGHSEAAREAAEEAAALAERLHYPVGTAASLEAMGATSTDPEEKVRTLAKAQTAWEGLGRPVDAQRCARLAMS